MNAPLIPFFGPCLDNRLTPTKLYPDDLKILNNKLIIVGKFLNELLVTGFLVGT